MVVCDFTLKIDPDVFNRWWLNFDWGVLCRLGLVWRTRRRRRAQAPNILRRYSLGVLPRGTCRRRRSRFSYAPPELDSSKLWFFCYILIVLLTLKKGEVEQAQVWIRRRRRVWPAACMCVAFMTEAPAVHKQSLFSTTPRSIWYANVRKFQYIEQIFEVFENCRENLRGYEMIVCMTTPCFFMSKITRHHPIQYEGFSSVWIQVDLIILFQIF